jgi:hypothetical protein
MFRQVVLCTSRCLTIGVGNVGFLSSFQGGYPHVDDAGLRGGKNWFLTALLIRPILANVDKTMKTDKFPGLPFYSPQVMHRKPAVDNDWDKLRYSHIHRPIYYYIFLYILIFIRRETKEDHA